MLSPKNGVTGSPQKGEGGKHFFPSKSKQPSFRQRAKTKLEKLSSSEQLKMLEGLTTAGDALSKVSECEERSDEVAAVSYPIFTLALPAIPRSWERSTLTWE